MSPAYPHPGRERCRAGERAASRPLPSAQDAWYPNERRKVVTGFFPNREELFHPVDPNFSALIRFKAGDGGPLSSLLPWGPTLARSLARFYLMHLGQEMRIKKYEVPGKLYVKKHSMNG